MTITITITKTIEIPMDLYNMILKYCYKPSNQEWTFMHDTLIGKNEDEVLVMGAAQSDSIASFKYNIYEKKFTKLKTDSNLISNLSHSLQI